MKRLIPIMGCRIRQVTRSRIPRHRMNIHGQQYRTYGHSKAKKLRSFWEQEPDVLVGRVLSESHTSDHA